jgi:glucose/arabinose dehydrogenase
MHRSSTLFHAVAAVALAAASAGASAQFAGLGTQVVASNLNAPLYATAPLADGRVFIVEKSGTIKVVQNGVTSNFISIPVATANEQGLLGLAFDPGYDNPASPGYKRFFVNYIEPNTLDTVVASYRTNSGNASLADPASRVEVIRIDQPNGRTNHKAGWIGFKPGDANSLYIATGDGGSGNDPDNLAQNKNTLLGKMLRIDINRDDFASPTVNYGIPADNPFVGQANARGEIFQFGLRNPFRNSFDRANGNLWIADVGQNDREEVNFTLASSAGGQNFGWRIREGSIDNPGVSDPNIPGLTDPLFDYDHSFGASITGGYVVRDANSPLFGRYVFGDFISGRIWAVNGSGGAVSFAQALDITDLLEAGTGGFLGNISSFGEGAQGQLFIVDYGGKVVVVVPEPGTYALWLAGLAGVAAVVRRRGAALRPKAAPASAARRRTRRRAAVRAARPRAATCAPAAARPAARLPARPGPGPGTPSGWRRVH